MFKFNKYFRTVIIAFCVSVSVIIVHDVFRNNRLRSKLLSDTTENNKTDSISKEIEDIVNPKRLRIKKEMLDYDILYSNISKVDDLFMELGGRPIRTLIISRGRTGSSFLAGVTASRSPHFYSFEPLVRFNTERIEGDDVTESVNDIRNIFECDYLKVKKYLEFLTKSTSFRMRNSIWSHCMFNTHLCQNPEFLTKLCRLFPFHTIKTIRLYLHQIEPLLNIEGFNLRAVVLVRDPRAVMNSRWKLGWCLNSDDCWRTASYCEDLMSEYRDVQRMAAKYPGKISVVRYEDLAMDPERATWKLFRSIGIAISPSVTDFVKLHTKRQINGDYSLFRNSADIPFKWAKELQFDIIEDIQITCKEPMSLWGYQPAMNASHLRSKSFRPVISYIPTYVPI